MSDTIFSLFVRYDHAKGSKRVLRSWLLDRMIIQGLRYGITYTPDWDEWNKMQIEA